jgi:hypothetical protein
MTNRDLLKEAIADAKTVKETAIANAKAALEEAFTPHLKSMLSAKLEEMDKDEEKDIEETITTEEVEEIEETKVDAQVEELDLDELLAEIEETETISETETEEVTEATEEVTETTEEVTEEEAEEAEEMEAEEMEDEEIDLEDMSEEDLKGFVEDVIKDMIEAGELEAGDDFEAEEEVEAEAEADLDVEDIEVEVEDEVEDMMEEGNEEVVNEEETTEEIEESEETVSTSLDEIEELKKELQEVNLLNAKLLYTNKIFKAKNLSEDRKVKVLKAFDKATTVKEAKVIFETLSEGITTNTKTYVNEVKGSASKATGLAPEAKQPIIENDAYRRMQKLAGIIK